MMDDLGLYLFNLQQRVSERIPFEGARTRCVSHNMENPETHVVEPFVVIEVRVPVKLITGDEEFRPPMLYAPPDYQPQGIELVSAPAIPLSDVDAKFDMVISAIIEHINQQRDSMNEDFQRMLKESGERLSQALRDFEGGDRYDFKTLMQTEYVEDDGIDYSYRTGSNT